MLESSGNHYVLNNQLWNVHIKANSSSKCSKSKSIPAHRTVPSAYTVAALGLWVTKANSAQEKTLILLYLLKNSNSFLLKNGNSFL